MWAVEAGNCEIVRLLLDSLSININKQRKDLTTALHTACTENKLEALKILLAHPDINVNIKDEEGRTALHMASIRGFMEIIDLLLSHRTMDTSLRTNNGKTAYDLCADSAAFRRLVEVSDLLCLFFVVSIVSLFFFFLSFHTDSQRENKRKRIVKVTQTNTKEYFH
jgi:ankyrin repeat protein